MKTVNDHVDHATPSSAVHWTSPAYPITLVPEVFATIIRLPFVIFASLRSYLSLLSFPSSTLRTLPPYEVHNGRTVFSWTDSASDAIGWIVIDNPFPTVAGGGLFMHAGATLQEVTDVASTMSYKLTVGSQPQVVGAKGGIRYDHRAPDASAVLERFVRDNAAVINQYWGTGGDLNTSHSEIDRYIHRYAGVDCALAPIARALGSPNSIKDILTVLRTSVPINGDQASLEEASVGYGAALAFRRLVLASAPHRMGSMRIALQGLGTVGATFAHYAVELGIGRIVGISSQFGYLICQDGIDVGNICRQRNQALVIDPSLDPKLLESGLTTSQLSDTSSYFLRRPGSSNDEHLCDFLAGIHADVFAPCAGRYVVSRSALDMLAETTFRGVPVGERFIVAGANNILHPEQDEQVWLSSLDAAGINMLPEWVTNSGTASIFMRACSGTFTLDRSEALLQACGQDVENFLESIFRTELDRAGGARLGTSGLFAACYDAARRIRARGAVNRLGVEHITHVECITKEAARAYETFTQVLGAVPLKQESPTDVKQFHLPGADDPTLSISPASPNATLADTGLHIFFAVTNLAKTRKVLEQDGFAFAVKSRDDIGEVIQLDGAQVGYPIGFVQGRGSSVPVGLPAPFNSQSTALGNVGVKQLDHYTLIVPDANIVKRFHEEYMGYTHLRTITLNAGSAPKDEDDMLNHVLALPNDSQRVLVVTEGLNPASVFSRLLERKHRPYVHHIAMQVSDVSAAFENVRAAGWGTTSDTISHDMLSGLRQFFIREEEVGCFLELIERATGRRKAGIRDEESEPGVEAAVQGDFKKGNMASLAQSMESYTAIR
ncbi:Glyoxalase/Bleomycin resistance protein/Dihydroxybiphenyl dioxygenase [Trametopsis cervina]|nr:Glyoxalase/Bleomycin resistance protein/Dihydroxybiphenyl dioxygenase [Trametopsis cervina]